VAGSGGHRGPAGGQRLLVHAAAGGVGHLTTQIAKARGAYVIGVGPRNHDVFDAHLPVHARDLACLPAALLPVQLLAYELALLRGTDPDKPRNLAKSVTVR
jgi:glucosamine--fructose-6-phosphate aminotransferase (isomerizing)